MAVSRACGRLTKSNWYNETRAVIVDKGRIALALSAWRIAILRRVKIVLINASLYWVSLGISSRSNVIVFTAVAPNRNLEYTDSPGGGVAIEMLMVSDQPNVAESIEDLKG